MTDGGADINRNIEPELQTQAVTEVFQYIKDGPGTAFMRIGEVMHNENGELVTYLDEQNATLGGPGNAFREGALWTYGVLRAQEKKMRTDPPLPTVSEDVFASIAGDMDEVRVLENWDPDDPMGFQNALSKTTATKLKEGDKILWRKLLEISRYRTDRSQLMDGALLTWLAIRKTQQAEEMKSRFPDAGS